MVWWVATVFIYPTYGVLCLSLEGWRHGRPVCSACKRKEPAGLPHGRRIWRNVVQGRVTVTSERLRREAEKGTDSVRVCIMYGGRRGSLVSVEGPEECRCKLIRRDFVCDNPAIGSDWQW